MIEENKNLNNNNLLITDNIMESDKNKKSKLVKNDLSNIKIIDKPIRNLPQLIEELLSKKFDVLLSINGYYVSGFYGLNKDIGKDGYIYCQETNELNSLIFYDAKGHKHLIKSFEDLVKLNSLIWGSFFKISEDYKKPNILWFNYMLELDVLNITPYSK